MTDKIGRVDDPVLGPLPDPQEANASRNGRQAPGRLRTRGVDLSRVRPLRWLWSKRIPIGLVALLVGEEGVGKSLFAAWLAARATRGELEGDFYGKPVNVMIVGDEDGFDLIWVPRLHLAGADLTRIRTLADGEDLDDLGKRAEDMATAIREDDAGFVIFDALMDHVPGGADGSAIYNPKNIRQALAPLRRVAAETEIAALGLMHPIKGEVTSFRRLIAASHQFNAVSRSSLLLGRDPEDDDRRVVVRGKGNHTATPRSVEFSIVGEAFELDGHGFEMPKVVELEEGDRTINDLLTGGDKKETLPQKLSRELADVLRPDQGQKLADLARAVERKPEDRMVRDALTLLQSAGAAMRDDKKLWWRTPGVAVPVPVPPSGRYRYRDGPGDDGQPQSAIFDYDDGGG